MKRLLALALPLLLSGCAAVDPFALNAALGRGVNLGNALDAPTEGEWGVTLREESFPLIREAGFQTVRLPVRWSAHADTNPPYAIAPAFFDRVDWVIAQALSNRLRVVLDIHHYDDLIRDPAGQRERFLAIWDQIAGHYRYRPDELLFEVLNEPNGDLTSDLWNDLLAEAVGVIRTTNPRRTLVIGTADWGGFGSIHKLRLPADDRNLIVTVHYYNPMQLTHQGASWVGGSEAWTGTTWCGTTEEMREIRRDFDLVAGWAATNRRPIFLGEFGAFSRADMNSRAWWTAFVARQAEARGMSWAYWEFCSGFGAYDPEHRTWRPMLLNALIP